MIWTISYLVHTNISLPSQTPESDLDGVIRGRGANEGSVVINDENSHLPVADADVWVTSDVAGTLVVAGTSQTDSEGKVTFWLDTGSTYYVWC